MKIILTSTFYSFIIFIVLISSVCTVYDVAIYGATPGGIAAAITAARSSPSSSIVIIEPTSNLGGMATADGIGLRDLGLEVTSKFLLRSTFISIF